MRGTRPWRSRGCGPGGTGAGSGGPEPPKGLGRGSGKGLSIEGTAGNRGRAAGGARGAATWSPVKASRRPVKKKNIKAPVKRRVLTSRLLIPQVLVIDGRGHLLGRLAAIVAKQVLLGECGAGLGIV